MTNWEKIEQRVSNISALKEELKLLRGGEKVIVKNPVPFILYSRPWESIIKKAKKEK